MRAFIAVVAGGALCVTLLACGSAKGKFGDACTVFAQTSDCNAGFECACRTEGCFCVNSCNNSSTASGCPSPENCLSGRNPATGSSAYYCWPATIDAGAP